MFKIGDIKTNKNGWQRRRIIDIEGDYITYETSFKYDSSLDKGKVVIDGDWTDWETLEYRNTVKKNSFYKWE